MSANLESNAPEPKPKRRWIRFGLRTLLIAVTLICVLLGATLLWYHAQETEYLRQLEIAQHLIELDCYVEWESELPDWLGWMRQWRISDAFQRATSIHASRLSASDEILAIIDERQKLPTVQSISIAWSSLTDESVAHIARFRSPTTLYLRNGEEGQESSQHQIDDVLYEARRKLPGMKIEYDASFP